MQDELVRALKKRMADYLEVRLEETSSTRIIYQGKTIDEVSQSVRHGGNVRALVHGSWGFVSFNEPPLARQRGAGRKEGEAGLSWYRDGLPWLEDKVSLAVTQASLATGEASLAPTEAVVAAPAGRGETRPQMAMSRKMEVLREYYDIILSTPKIQAASIVYQDSLRRVTLITSEGSYIEQVKPDLSFRLTAIARDGDQVQQVGLSWGSPGDFSAIEGRSREVKEAAQRAVKLISAPHIKIGEHTVILDPVLAGVFVHEAFGHLSEADHVYQNDKLRELMTLGKRFGSPKLNIVDDATIPGLRASYHYDEEGVPAGKNHLIREGILVGRLHSRETAARMAEKPTGNSRAISYLYPPIVRMTNTLIERGDVSWEDMVSEVKEGVYVKGWYGGVTGLEMFTFSAGEAYMIRNGRLEEMLRPVVLSGNVFVTLNNIDAIGNDFGLNQGGGCGKGEQSPLPVTNGSPHIRITRCLVGGRQGGH
ncbi:MAG: TldD/PmbA family protein [Chloroflexota bacterium]